MSERLIDRWVSGSASAEDRSELIALIEADPSLVTKLYHSAERECDLHDFYGNTRKLTLRTPRANPRAHPRSVLRHRVRAHASRWVPMAAGIAALVFICVLLTMVKDSQLETTETTNLALALSAVPENDLTVAPSTSPFPIADNQIFPEPGFTKDIPLPKVPSRPVNRAPTKSSVLLATKPKPKISQENQPVAAREKPTVGVPGFDRSDGELKDEANDLVMRYSLRAPTRLPQQPQLGLLLAFHGANGNENYLAEPLLKALAQSGQQPDMIVASLKSSGDDWTTKDEPNIISFINWALRTYPIDPRRVVIIGTSNGGWLVNYFGSRHPELIAGVVAVCGSNGFEMPAKRPTNASETGFDYYVLHGTADEDVPVKHARAVAEALRTNGYRYVYREYPNVGHDIFSDKETRADFASWMTRLRHKTMPLSDFDRKALSAFNKTDRAEILMMTDEGAQTLIHIGGLPAEKILARALRSKSPEVRARATSLFANMSCMPGASALIASGLNDKESTVRNATIATLARLADWNDQEALIALCLFAGNHTHPLDERLTIVTDLTASFAMRCTPSSSNQPIYELLIHLLDDEEETLREKAIASLLGHHNDALGYLPDLPSSGRRESVIAWRHWYTELFTPPPAKP
jgi:pimeloyl-ACP methyl ester carboxylesterase